VASFLQAVGTIPSGGHTVHANFAMNTKTIRVMFLFLLVGIASGGSVRAHAYPSARQEEGQTANSARGKGYRITVTTVQPRPTEQGATLYAVTYTYEFVDRKTVIIRGIGEVPAKGQLSYLTPDEYLEFKDPASNAVITVRLKVTKAPEGGSMEIPAESDFTPFFVSESRPNQSIFYLRAQTVLNGLFPSGYVVRQNGKTNYYMTTYRSLEGLPDNLRGQVAVLISHPYDIDSDRFTFHIQFIAREKPKKSGEWQYVLSDEVKKLAEEFVQRLSNDLKAQ
jgi:hypothetical protein